MSLSGWPSWVSSAPIRLPSWGQLLNLCPSQGHDRCTRGHTGTHRASQGPGSEEPHHLLDLPAMCQSKSHDGNRSQRGSHIPAPGRPLLSAEFRDRRRAEDGSVHRAWRAALLTSVTPTESGPGTHASRCDLGKPSTRFSFLLSW